VTEYLIRVRATDGGYTASIRQFAKTSHPEVRAVTGPVHYGEGKTEPAAILAAIAASRLPEIPSAAQGARNGS